MAAETTMVIAAATTAAAFLLAGAAGSPDPVTAASDAVEVAQAVAKMSEERVLLISLGGGLLGSFVAFGFGLFKGSSQQIAMRFAGSAVAAVLAGPAFMIWRDVPHGVIPTLCVAGAFGLCAHMLIPIAVEYVPDLVRAKLRKWLRKDGDDETKEEKT